jgi:hypothetical protein
MATKIKKANITSPYPTANDVAELLRVPRARVERLAEELMQFQRNDVRAALGASRRGIRKATEKRVKSETGRKERAGRASRA